MVVPPSAVGLSVRWKTQLASRKVCPGLRYVLLKNQISTPWWLRKCSNSNFLPCTPSAFQQARRRSLRRSAFLGRAAIFCYKKNDGLQDSERASCPCEEGRDGREEPTSQLHTCIRLHTRIHAYIHTYIHTYIHKCIHTYIHARIHTYMHTYIHAYTHTYMHTHIHTYIHTYTIGIVYIRCLILLW